MIDRKPKHTFEEWESTVKYVCGLFKKAGIEYAMVGSGACVFHHVKFPENDNPKDIDIIVSNSRAAIQLLTKEMKSKEYTITESPDSSIVVRRYSIQLKGKSPIEIDLMHGEDFGLSTVQKEEKKGIIVISLVETLLSLLDRMTKRGARPKDVFAFRNLIANNAEYLKESTELHNHPNKNFSKEILTCVESVLNKEKEIQRIKAEKTANDALFLQKRSVR